MSAGEIKHVLMIAYHFPPVQGSSGLQRTLRFARYLPEYGWTPIVLTAHPRAYSLRDESLVRELSDSVQVHRAFALDASRHLAIHGKYPKLFGIPDRYSSWFLGAVPAALRLVRKYRPKAIWSTYPIATAHLIGAVVHRLTSLPWIADFRDPMLYEAWPEDPFERRVHGWLERLAVRHCARAILVAQSAVEMYQQRYPQLPKERFAVISNGYDEGSFAGLVRQPRPRAVRPLTLIHSGLLEPADRDPNALFAAIQQLKLAGQVSASELKVVLRASGFDRQYENDIRRKGVQDIVSLQPTVGYRAALQEMLDSDGLLVFQGPTCNRQIPAKLYEYLRAGTPILAIVDPQGETYRLLRDLGVASWACFGDASAIARKLSEFLDQIKSDTIPRPATAIVARYERRALTALLGEQLDQIAREKP
jgi:glycosyltransferase involved in cell wall biosynthesis